MLRTILSIGVLAILGLIALKFAFGIFAGLLGLLLWLLVIAIKLAIVGGVVYLVLRLVAPDTARRLREKFGR